ncbi:hypothetical protein BGX29_008080, partial [Mortierella sp. GBA35]
MAHNIKRIFQLPQHTENSPSPLPDTVISYVDDPPTMTIPAPPSDDQIQVNTLQDQLQALTIGADQESPYQASPIEVTMIVYVEGNEAE